MTTSRILFLVLLFITAIFFIIALSRFALDLSLVNALIAFLPPMFVAAIGFAIDPIREDLNSFLNRERLIPFCMIYLYGRPGTGKTSLIKSWLQGDRKPERSTQVFDYYSHRVLDYLGNQKFIRIKIADYQGQKPSQIINNEKLQLANALLFIVDIVPRYDEDDNSLDTPEKQLAWLSSCTEEKVKKRVEEHYTHIVGSLEPLFTTLFNDNLFSVRLVINKYDLLEVLAQDNLLPSISIEEVDQYTLGLFKKIEVEIRRACQINKIEDISVILVSTETDFHIRDLLTGILDTYKDMQKNGK